MTTRMFLRVKRRRSTTPASTIRLEGLVDEMKTSCSGSSAAATTTTIAGGGGIGGIPGESGGGGGDDGGGSSGGGAQQQQHVYSNIASTNWIIQQHQQTRERQRQQQEQQRQLQLQQQQQQQKQQQQHTQAHAMGGGGEEQQRREHGEVEVDGVGVGGCLDSTSPSKRSCAVWKRLDTNDLNKTAAGGIGMDGGDMLMMNNNKDGKRERSYYVVADAILEGVYDRSSKRRKLTLVETSHHEEFPLPSLVNASSSPIGSARFDSKTIHNNSNNDSLLDKNGSGNKFFGSSRRGGGRNNKNRILKYPVLDPLSRLVDDSLKMLHSGTITVAQHYTFVMTDPRVAPDSRKWMAWCNEAGGNVLHACARWNDVEIAHDLLKSQIDGLTDAVDGDGCTPYETAQMCGHDSVCQIMEAFGADTSNYVYDIFCLQKQDAAEMTTSTIIASGNTHGEKDRDIQLPKHQEGKDNPEDHQDQDEAPVSLELRGGVGYWTEDGELILEPTSKEESNTDEYQEDIDSNCEDYGGNDYPDEDEQWEEEFLYGGDRNALEQQHQYHNANYDPYDHHGYYDDQRETEPEQFLDYAYTPEYLYE